jgi:hypothetical protein
LTGRILSLILFQYADWANSNPESMRQSRIVITGSKGISPFLREEVRSLGLAVLSEALAGVETEGTMDDARPGDGLLFSTAT